MAERTPSREDLRRWWQTLRPLPWQMHGFRAVNDLRKRAWTPLLPGLVALWQARGREAARHVRLAALQGLGTRLQGAAAPDARGLCAGTLALSGLQVPFPPEDWRLPGALPLQVYEAQYLDWADALAARIADTGEVEVVTLAERTLTGWQAASPHLAKAWEPYPRARRTLACLRGAARLEALALHGRDRLQGSHLALRDQLLAIAASAAMDLGPLLERHLGGNHLLVDRIALAAAEVAWGEGDRHLQAAVAEADRQFPGDGAHVEASPMYHAQSCEDLLLLRGLVTTPGPLGKRLDSVLERALAWLAAVRHPDGRLPAFGDSDAAALDHLPLVRTALRRPGVTDPRQSVWTSRHGGHLAIVHTAPPAYAPQPGHAHDDTLAVEWSCNDVRILADAGLAGYEGDRHRELNRSVASHSTVEIAGFPALELWASFRVGARGRVLAVDHGHAHGWDWLTAVHVWPRETHRHLRLVAQHPRGRLVIVDALRARDGTARGIARWILAPGVQAEGIEALRVGHQRLQVTCLGEVQLGSGLRFPERGGAATTGPELQVTVLHEPVWTLLGGDAEDLAVAERALLGAWHALATRKDVG
jgi:hypothetical protein